jgi:hypothetical protein
MAATLVKTDKNGTRYYESDDCPKCGGSGVIREYGHIEGDYMTRMRNIIGGACR